LTDPEFRARLFAGPPEGGTRGLAGAWGRMYFMESRPDYEPSPESSVAARARALGAAPEAVALDHMLKDGGRGMLYVPFLNYAEGSLDAVHAMIDHPHSVPGLSDGGAHVGMICDGSFPTFMITHWTRDRARGPKLALEAVVRMQTRDTARAVGLHDRGLIAPGYRADLNVIDHGGLTLHAPKVAHDLPAGGRRLIQKAGGYVVTLVAGQVTYRDGEPTGALPGRLLRGARSAPMAIAGE
ncbi:MAG: amidohydrolase family protein, partial [Caulobacteraceae bacterium]|nr:amidohydrolase family protein [Caulobacteraceae bacterium]